MADALAINRPEVLAAVGAERPVAIGDKFEIELRADHLDPSLKRLPLAGKYFEPGWWLICEVTPAPRDHRPTLVRDRRDGMLRVVGEVLPEHDVLAFGRGVDLP
jgi:hypothetical protein